MKLRLLRVSPEMLLAMCQHGTNGVTVVEHAVPVDAVIRAVHAEPSLHNTVTLQIESSQFEDVPEGGLIPDHPRVMFRKVADK